MWNRFKMVSYFPFFIHMKLLETNILSVYGLHYVKPFFLFLHISTIQKKCTKISFESYVHTIPAMVLLVNEISVNFKGLHVVNNHKVSALYQEIICLSISLLNDII